MYGVTPGLRIPLRRADDFSFLLFFGEQQERPELVTAAQLLTLLSEAAQEMGLSLCAPPQRDMEGGSLP
ncbi:hypothetical protein [Streptomyces sp. RFCAC02]|uniref:hypothetical protein n=1 Tax=Streptomyces sp. RFCAC02 TaxID=2499143 RepID=UPI0010207946|nr:hypothetical protein [Streptomyces sp. RFCAC02]